MVNHLRTELVLEALEVAINQRQPLEVIHHSDRGGQYTSPARNASSWIATAPGPETKQGEPCLSLLKAGTTHIDAT
jgi:hypothetical protein